MVQANIDAIDDMNEAAESVRPADLARVLSPSSVAIVGASGREGTPGHGVLANLERLGFPGRTYPVNPAYEELGGERCYPSLTSLPEVPDTVVTCVGRDRVLPLLREAAGAGVRGAVVLAAGFGESESGAVADRQLRELSAASGLRIVGPNCLGTVDLRRRAALYSTPLPDETRVGGIGLISHSGSGCIALTTSRRLGFSYVVSAGNEACVTCGDYMDVLASDPHTTVIALVLETLRDPESFAAAVHRARERGKPVVALKLGKSRRGAEATATHTGALAGYAEVYDAFFRRHGVLTVDDMDELVETAQTFDRSTAAPSGNSLGVLTLSGGESALICDLAEQNGLELAALGEATRRRLREALPDFANINNPLDVTGAGVHDPVLYRRCAEQLLADPSVDVMAVIQDSSPGLSDEQAHTYAALIHQIGELATTTDVRKPIVTLSTTGQGLHDTIAAELADAPVPLLQGARESMRAIRALVHYGSAEVDNSSADLAAAPPGYHDSDVAAVLERMRHGNPTHPTDGDMHELLRAAGVTLPEQQVCGSVDEAVSAAARIGYPVALKVAVPGLLHKSDVGGVQLGIRSDAELRDRFDLVLGATSALRPDQRFQVCVQQMIEDGVEALVGFRYVEPFAGVLVVGVGGISAELVDDVTLEMLPVSEHALRSAVTRTRLDILLGGHRGRASADRAAFVDLLCRVARLCEQSTGVLRELDLNPVLVRPGRQGVCVVDVAGLL